MMVVRLLAEELSCKPSWVPQDSWQVVLSPVKRLFIARASVKRTNKCNSGAAQRCSDTGVKQEAKSRPESPHSATPSSSAWSPVGIKLGVLSVKAAGNLLLMGVREDPRSNSSVWSLCKFSQNIYISCCTLQKRFPGCIRTGTGLSCTPSAEAACSYHVKGTTAAQLKRSSSCGDRAVSTNMLLFCTVCGGAKPAEAPSGLRVEVWDPQTEASWQHMS